MVKIQVNFKASMVKIHTNIITLMVKIQVNFGQLMVKIHTNIKIFMVILLYILLNKSQTEFIYLPKFIYLPTFSFKQNLLICSIFGFNS